MKAIALISGFYAVAALAQTAPPIPYVAHEWGTFTSVQGMDGVQMIWNPRTPVELPKFVYPRLQPYGALGLAKFGACRQRMETPVIYFYSEDEQDIDVAVDFPQGNITEWYPRCAPADRLKSFTEERGLAKIPSLLWPGIHLLPMRGAAGLAQRLPKDGNGSHYFAARETDSDFVQTSPANGAAEVEKFLFYRGLGMFEAPLTVKLEGVDGETIRVENHGPESLAEMYLLENATTHRGWCKIDRLNPGEARSMQVDRFAPANSLEVLESTLGAQVRETLTRQGLYPREAAAMVKTWEDTWFAEPGLRVLYPVPRQFTDGVLPLRLTPDPKALVRVMIGRAEVITPEAERRMTDAVQRFMNAEESMRPQIVDEVRRFGYGRFGEPILQRVLATFDDAKTERFYKAGGGQLH